MRICFVVNPGSGSGNRRGAKALAFINSWLARHPDQPHRLSITKSLSDAEHLAISAHQDGFERIVAVGGDGTINGVLNSFYDQQGSLRSGARMGVVYTGTSPDFCKSYGIPLDAEPALAVVVAEPAVVRDIPVADCQLAPSPDSQVSIVRRFACCANIGIGPSLARAANSGARHRWGDFLGTLTSLLMLLGKFRPMDFELVQDGKTFAVRNVTNLFLGLTHHVASGLQVANDLASHPGCLYKLTVADLRPTGVARGLLVLYGGLKVAGTGSFALDYFRELEVRHPGGPAEVEFDGDPAGFLPAAFRLAGASLPILVGSSAVAKTQGAP